MPGKQLDYAALRMDCDGIQLPRRPGDAAVVDFSRITPTLLPDALRHASRRALDHAADPLNQLDFNPYIADEWVIVASELWSLATALERRLFALYDGKTVAAAAPSVEPVTRARRRFF